MSSAIADRVIPEGQVRVLERRRSNAAGLHVGRPRGNRRAVRAAAIDESLTSYGDFDDTTADCIV